MLPNKPRGIPRVDDRRIFNGICWVLHLGAPWRDLPHSYGTPMTWSKLEQRALPPEVLEAKVAVAKALREVEVGWERARAKIALRGGLEKRPTGPVNAAA